MQLEILVCPNCDADIKHIPKEYYVPVHCDSCRMDFLREKPMLHEINSIHRERINRTKVNKKLKTMIIIAAVVLMIVGLLGVGVLIWLIQMLKGAVN